MSQKGADSPQHGPPTPDTRLNGTHARMTPLPHRHLIRVCLLGFVLGAGCKRDRPTTPPKARRILELNQQSVAAAVPAPSLRNEWAVSILAALKQIRQPATRSSVCAVIAIIAQESNFQANPAVPALASVVKRQLNAYEAKYGRPGKTLIRSLLAGRATKGARTFAERLAAVKTERDLDLTFRDMLAYQKQLHPIAFGAATVAGKVWDGRSLQELNPIATAGAMQVSVAFAEEWADDHDLPQSKVRDSLYTISGGVLFGTARLFYRDANYDEMIFRFADYNAGVFASRNAAFQAQLGRLLGTPLTLDGDLLRYEADGDTSSEESQTFAALKRFTDQHHLDLSPWRLRQDAALEKQASFEQTATYKAVKVQFEKKFKSSPRYAILPQAEIDSPKLRGKRSAVNYAQAAQRRYQSCLIAQ